MTHKPIISPIDRMMGSFLTGFSREPRPHVSFGNGPVTVHSDLLSGRLQSISKTYNGFSVVYGFSTKSFRVSRESELNDPLHWSNNPIFSERQKSDPIPVEHANITSIPEIERFKLDVLAAAEARTEVKDSLRGHEDSFKPANVPKPQP